MSEPLTDEERQELTAILLEAWEVWEQNANPEAVSAIKKAFHLLGLPLPPVRDNHPAR